MSQLHALVEKHYHQINTQNFDDASEIFSSDVETAAPGAPLMRGIEPFVAYGKAFVAAFPDGQIKLDSAIESGDTIIVEGHFTGTNTGPVQGPAGEMPATGRSIDLPFADVFQVKDGHVVSHRIYFDQLGMLAQLGLMAPGSGA